MFNEMAVEKAYLKGYSQGIRDIKQTYKFNITLPCAINDKIFICEYNKHQGIYELKEDKVKGFFFNEKAKDNIEVMVIDSSGVKHSYNPKGYIGAFNSYLKCLERVKFLNEQ